MVRRRIGLAAAALAASVGLVPSPARAESPEETFLRGNRAYDAGRHDEAVQAYEELIERGVIDPRVEFNLGNTEFRRGRIGSAILHFQRARRLAPTDPEIRANLAFARAAAGDSRESSAALPAPLAWIRRVVDGVGPARLAWTVLVLAWFAWAVLAWGLAEPGRFRALHGWILAGLVAALAVTSTAWYVTHRQLVTMQVAVVLSSQAAVLAGPGENNAQLATVPEGLELEVWGKRPDWVNVRLPNSVSGWIAEDAVGLVP